MPIPTFTIQEPIADTELGSLLAVDPAQAGVSESAATGRSSPLAKAFHDAKLPTLAPARDGLLDRATSLRVWLLLTRRFLWLLVPSFIQSRISKDPPKPEKLHPTAYLDGMRGLAAFAVFLNHLTYQTFEIDFAFGAQRPGDNTLPIQLPIVRLLYSGAPMVAIFFVISGYALSAKPIRLMRAGQSGALLESLSSSVFRRGLRLYLPCFASTFGVALLCQLGAYTATLEQFRRMRVPRPDDHAWTAPGPLAQLTHWLHSMVDFVHPWEWMIFGGSIDYDRHLWTIPVEFRASMALFLTQLMTARMRPGLRLATYAALAYWAVHWDRWEAALFFAGAVLAEVNLIAPLSTTATSTETTKARHLPLYHTLFVLGLFLASYPEREASSTPGFRTLAALVPSYFSDPARFWPCVAAVLLVGSAGRSPALRAAFASPPAQYLGRISFALYLVHGPIIHTVGYAALAPAYAAANAQAGWRLEAGFAGAAALTLLVAVWAADVFWRVVDTQCVRFARWVEERFVVERA